MSSYPTQQIGGNFQPQVVLAYNQQPQAGLTNNLSSNDETKYICEQISECPQRWKIVSVVLIVTGFIGTLVIFSLGRMDLIFAVILPLGFLLFLNTKINGNWNEFKLKQRENLERLNQQQQQRHEQNSQQQQQQQYSNYYQTNEQFKQQHSMQLQQNQQPPNLQTQRPQGFFNPPNPIQQTTTQQTQPTDQLQRPKPKEDPRKSSNQEQNNITNDPGSSYGYKPTVLDRELESYPPPPSYYDAMGGK